MAELSAKMQKLPTAFVMTTATLQAVKDRLGEDDYAGDADAVGFGFLSLLAGVAVEDYPTVRECLDRMVNQQPGERLQLVSDGPMPDDCLSHPWLTKYAASLAEKLRSDEPKRVRESMFGSSDFRWGVTFGG